MFLNLIPFVCRIFFLLQTYLSYYQYSMGNLYICVTYLEY
jgi:hypothetical protein